MKKLNISNSFKGKRIFITGHTGFKGAWLTFMLHKLGAEIYAVSLSEPEDKKHAYYALNIGSLIVNKQNSLQNICNYHALQNSINEYRPDYLFHLAAQAIVSDSYNDPLSTIESNVLGTTNILEVIRNFTGDLTALIITSDKCYRNKERLTPYQEDDEMGGEDPYSASKGCCELLFNAYLKSFYISDSTKHVATARAGNVFGGGDWSNDRLVPDCIKNIVYGPGLVKIRSPESIRPWTYVLEVLFGYLLLAQNLFEDKSLQGSWNFANAEIKTVKELCKELIAILGFGEISIDKGFSIGKEGKLLLIDDTKAKEKIGWKPVFSFEHSMKITADWYTNQAKGTNMYKFSESLLDNYFSRAY